MPDPKGPYVARVLKFRSWPATQYVTALAVPPPDGPGVLTDSATYTIPDDTVQPRPVVSLDLGYLHDEGTGDDTVVWEERVQWVYRSLQPTDEMDPETKQISTVWTYCVLVYIATSAGLPREAKQFLWNTDANLDPSVQPPVFPANGTCWFGADLWTLVGP